MKRLFSNSRGDTIMEVLISIAVLSLILAVSFALANRSSLANVQARERGEGLKFSETQLERLKTYLSSPGLPALPSSGQQFCMKQKSVDPAVPNDIGVGPELFTSAVSTNPTTITTASYPAACKDTQNSRYHTVITRDSTDTNKFTVTSLWDSVNGNGIERNDLVYRIYPYVAGSGSTGGFGGITPATPPTTGPPPVTYNVSISNPSICVATEQPLNDAYSGCKYIDGGLNGFYAFRNVSFSYSLPLIVQQNPGAGITLEIQYRQNGSPLLPTYSFNLTSSLVAPGQFSLPASNPIPYARHTFVGTVTIPYDNIIDFQWTNNAVAGSDANLQIDKVLLCKPALPSGKCSE